MVEELKKASSKWAKETIHPSFYWQNGYGAFSVSPSIVEQVVKYIENQEAHHSRRTFKDEYLSLLKRFKVDYEDRYLFQWIEPG